MTGLDRLGYQKPLGARLRATQPEVLLWLAMMILARLLLPPVGQNVGCPDHCRIGLLAVRISLWRWCRWMAIPFGFLLVGVMARLSSGIGREPQMPLAGISVGPCWIGITRAGVVRQMTFWRNDGAVRDVVADDEPTVSAVE